MPVWMWWKQECLFACPETNPDFPVVELVANPPDLLEYQAMGRAQPTGSANCKSMNNFLCFLFKKYNYVTVQCEKKELENLA
jgi:hypothetical protein